MRLTSTVAREDGMLDQKRLAVAGLFVAVVVLLLCLVVIEVVGFLWTSS